MSDLVLTHAGILLMDATEARAVLDDMRADLVQVDTSLSSFRQRALAFKEREGWKALGYSGWIEAIRAELGVAYSKSYLSRLIKAAEIEQILELPIGNSIPESQLRPLAELDTPDQQRAAWQRAGELAGAGQRTAAHVAHAARERARCIQCGASWGAPGSTFGPQGYLCPACARSRRAVAPSASQQPESAAAPGPAAAPPPAPAPSLASATPPAPASASAPAARPALIFTCERCGAIATQYVNVAGIKEHRCAACGRIPIRPARPRNEGISEWLEYAKQLEWYADELEILVKP